MTAAILLIENILAACIRMAAPLTIAGLGEALSEHAGILNLGLEAIMLCGAFASFITTFFTNSLALGISAGILAGAVIAMIHAALCIRFRANQTIVGLALNFFALGLTGFLFLLSFGRSSVLPQCSTVQSIPLPILSRIPFLGTVLFSHHIFVYLAMVLIFVFLFLYRKTEWGVMITAVGEHPRAADTAGLNVYRVRYAACLANGILGGLAGSYFTLAQLGFFMEDITRGKGYMAIVAVILGRREPVRIFFSALIIGFADAIQFQLQTMNIPIPSQAFSILPYIAAVFVLLFSAGKNADPAALGVPYQRGSR